MQYAVTKKKEKASMYQKLVNQTFKMVNSKVIQTVELKTLNQAWGVHPGTDAVCGSKDYRAFILFWGIGLVFTAKEQSYCIIHQIWILVSDFHRTGCLIHFY